MDVDYSHEQFGTVIVAFIAILSLALCIVFVAVGVPLMAAWTAFGAVVFIILFFRLRVEVSGRQLRLRFGMGLVGKSFDVSDIAAARPARSKWWYGIGIRLTPRGWLFSVSGLDVVEIELRSGWRCLIGTDEPEQLSAALHRAMAG